MDHQLISQELFLDKSRLVFDLGMNNGDDTKYYLAKGYSVLAVEANPLLCEQAYDKYFNAISSGKLIILNAAVTDCIKESVFYVNTDNTHWSSLDIGWASRNNSSITPITVKGTTIQEIVRQYGCPFFLKIDIEGADIVVLRQLLEMNRCPQFLSVEDCRFGFEYLQLLHKCGYRRFKLSNQAIVPQMKDHSIKHTFPIGSSGMFGDELPGKWLSYDNFLEHYQITVRSRESLIKIAAPDVWWDLHCAI